MKLIIFLWSLAVVQLLLAGINVGVAMENGSTWNAAVGIFCAFLGGICVGMNAYTTYTRGRTAGIDWTRELFRR